METIKIYLNPLQRKYKWSPYYYSIMGIVYILLGVVNYFAHNYSLLMGLIWFLGGLIFLIGGYYQINHSSKYFLEISDAFIQVKQSSFKNSKIEWSNVKLILCKPISIEFQLENGSKEEISLGNIGYKNVIDIKAKLLEFAKQKKIKVT